MPRCNRSSTLAALLMAALVLAAAAAHAETIVPKIDNFILFVDQSGAMAQKYEKLAGKKIILARDLLARLNAVIPALPYNSGVALFAPYQVLSSPAAYDKTKLGATVGTIPTDFDIFGRNTPFGFGLKDLSPVIAKLKGTIALIILTDGDSNYGSDPVAEAKVLLDQAGGRLCIHVVSFADTPNGRMIIDGIRALNSCTVNASVESLADQKALDKFARDVFYDVKPDAPAPAPARSMPVEPPQVITFQLNFGFDKYTIVDEMVPTLEQALLILKEKPGRNFEIAGHTDNIGPKDYNQKLSERRANSVAQWLIKNGIDAKRLTVVGYGLTRPKADNATREGRKINRRVEITSVK